MAHTEAVIRRCSSFAKFIEKHLCRSLSLIKLQPKTLHLYQKVYRTDLFSRIFEVLKHTYFANHLGAVASEFWLIVIVEMINIWLNLRRPLNFVSS